MVKQNAEEIQVLCFPFHSILFAIGNPSVDYFSLDIEGIELDVLKTIPWDKVDIKVACIVQLVNEYIMIFHKSICYHISILI